MLRFGLAGVAGLVVDLGALVALRSGAGWPLAVASGAAFALGWAANYGLVRLWVFRGVAPGGEAGRLGRYLVLAAGNAAATVVVVSGLTWLGADYRLAKVVAVVGLFATNYVLVPRVVMTSPFSRAGGPG